MSRGKKLVAPLAGAGAVALIASGAFALGTVGGESEPEPDRVEIVGQDSEPSESATPTPSPTQPAKPKKVAPPAEPADTTIDEPAQQSEPETMEPASEPQQQEEVVAQTQAPEPIAEPTYSAEQGNNPDAPPVAEETNVLPPSPKPYDGDTIPPAN